MDLPSRDPENLRTIHFFTTTDNSWIDRNGKTVSGWNRNGQRLQILTTSAVRFTMQNRTETQSPGASWGS